MNRMNLFANKRARRTLVFSIVQVMNAKKVLQDYNYIKFEDNDYCMVD